MAGASNLKSALIGVEHGLLDGMILLLVVSVAVIVLMILCFVVRVAVKTMGAVLIQLGEMSVGVIAGQVVCPELREMMRMVRYLEELCLNSVWTSCHGKTGTLHMPTKHTKENVASQYFSTSSC